MDTWFLFCEHICRKGVAEQKFYPDFEGNGDEKTDNEFSNLKRDRSFDGKIHIAIFKIPADTESNPCSRYVRLLSFSSMGNLPLSMDSKKISSIIFHSKLIYFRCPNGHLISFLRTLSIKPFFCQSFIIFLYFYQIFYCSSRNFDV